MKQRTRKVMGLEKRSPGERRTVRQAAEDLVEIVPLTEGSPLPYLVRPRTGEVDLVEWASAHRELIEDRLQSVGALLFRGFRLGEPERFFELAGVLAGELADYVEGSSPRIQVEDKLYTSTEYPADQEISMHNELSYAHQWPGRILFHCTTAAESGGETPIADSRRVFELLDPEIRQRFLRSGVRYVRNLHDGAGRGVGLSWQAVFETDDKEWIERYCRDGAIDFEWKDDGSLWTSQLRPAGLIHPQTGDELWFNQVHQFHPSNLGEETASALTAVSDESELPINACYGDGTPLEADALEAVRAAYAEAQVAFPWREGDVLLLDNMLVSHGRRPFEGPRKVLVSMGDTWRLEQVGRGEGMATAEPTSTGER